MAGFGKFTWFASVAALFFFLTSCLSTRRVSVIEQIPLHEHPGAFRGPEIFEGPVRSVLEHRCIHCHNSGMINGGLNLQDRKLVFAGDAAGAFIVPGKPDESRIWKVLFLPEKHPKMMPADGWGLTLYEMQAFRAWIEAGAYWPEGRKGELKPKPYAFGDTMPLRH